MMNSTDTNQENNNELTEEVQFEEEGSSDLEDLVRSVVKAYQEAFNRNNEKNEIKFSLTITNHKVATKDGNKDVAYLRLDRSIRAKGESDEEWTTRLLHQEAYFFRNMQERVNPKAPWKDQLFLNCIGRLVGAGLEYAELLQRLKQTELAKEKAGITDEDRLNNLGLVKADSLTELSPEDKAYAEHIKKEKSKLNLL